MRQGVGAFTAHCGPPDLLGGKVNVCFSEQKAQSQQLMNLCINTPMPSLISPVVLFPSFFQLLYFHVTFPSPYILYLSFSRTPSLILWNKVSPLRCQGCGASRIST